MGVAENRAHNFPSPVHWCGACWRSHSREVALFLWSRPAPNLSRWSPSTSCSVAVSWLAACLLLFAASVVWLALLSYVFPRPWPWREHSAVWPGHSASCLQFIHLVFWPTRPTSKHVYTPAVAEDLSHLGQRWSHCDGLVACLCELALMKNTSGLIVKLWEDCFV